MFQLYSKVIQVKFFPIIDYYKIVNVVTCDILYIMVCLIWYLTY